MPALCSCFPLFAFGSSIQMMMMNVETDGFQKNSIFSPRSSNLGKSPEKHPSPSGNSPAKQPSSLGKSPAKRPSLFLGGKSPAKQDKEKPRQSSSSSTCCGSCLGMGSSQSHPGHQLHAHPEREFQRRTDVTATYRAKLERQQEYVSPRLSSPAHNLTIVIAQAKINGWYIEPHEIELHEQIGSGTTADIYRGSWKGVDVAVKCINPNIFLSNKTSVTYFAQEIETLSRQRHPFVLRLVGACLDPPKYGWVVTEMLNMTLKEWLHGYGSSRRRERSFALPPFQDRLSKALEIAQAMQYLHDQKPKLLHRDLKPSNIFLDNAMHVRIADFGHARFLWEDEQALTGETGTFVYMAPEVIRYEPYDEKCDVYSYAVILNELITGDHPYIETDYSPAEIALAVGKGKLRPALPEDNGQFKELIDLIRSAWDGDMSIRPSFAIITCSLRKIQERLVAIC